MAAGDLTANPLASWSFGRSPPSDAPDLPKWSSITPEHVKPAIMAAVDKVNAEIDAIEAEGGKVLFAFVLVDREEGGRQALEERGVKVVSLFTRAELLADS